MESDHSSTKDDMNDEYQILRELNANVRTGEVFEAQHKLYGHCVVKLLPAANFAGISAEEYQEKMREAVMLLPLVKHANIVTIRTAGPLQLVQDGERMKRYGFVMEFVEGGNLAEYLTRHKYENGKFLDVTIAVNLVIKILSALEFAYSQLKPIVHRDIKLENILVNESLLEVKICDFGVAQFLDNTQYFLLASGTPAYKPPEVIQGLICKKRADSHRGDVWAVGVILWHLLSNHFPFCPFIAEGSENLNKKEFSIARLVQDGLLLSSQNKNVDAVLEQIILGALNTTPEARFSAKEFREKLEEWKANRHFTGMVFLQNLSPPPPLRPEAPPPPPTPIPVSPPPPPPPRTPWVNIILIGFLFTILLAAGAFLIWEKSLHKEDTKFSENKTLSVTAPSEKQTAPENTPPPALPEKTPTPPGPPGEGSANNAPAPVLVPELDAFLKTLSTRILPRAYDLIIDSDAKLKQWAKGDAIYEKVLIKKGAFGNWEQINLSKSGTKVIVGEDESLLSVRLFYETMPESTEYYIHNVHIETKGFDLYWTPGYKGAFDSGVIEKCVNLSNCSVRTNAINSRGRKEVTAFAHCKNLVNCEADIRMENYGITYCFGFLQCKNLYKCKGVGLKSGIGSSDTRGFFGSKNLYYCVGHSTWQNWCDSIGACEGVYNSVAIGVAMKECNDVHYSKAPAYQKSFSTPKNSLSPEKCANTAEGGWNIIEDPLENRLVGVLPDSSSPKEPSERRSKRRDKPTSVPKISSAEDNAPKASVSEKGETVAPLKNDGVKQGEDFATAEFQVSMTTQQPLNVVFEDNVAGDGGAAIANENNGVVIFGSEDELPPGKRASVVFPPNIVFKGNKAGKTGSVIYNNGGTIVFSNGKRTVYLEIGKGNTLHLCYGEASEYHQNKGPVFILRIVFEDGRIAHFTNREEIMSRLAGAVLMHSEKGSFSAVIEQGGKIKSAIVDYGASAKHSSINKLNNDNNGNPVFSALKFVNPK